VQTPRRCGAATFFLRPLPDFRPGVDSFFAFAVRPLRTSWLVVGMRRGMVAARPWPPARAGPRVTEADGAPSPAPQAGRRPAAAPRTARPATDDGPARFSRPAQDLRAARLALRARSARLSAAAVDAALTSERSLVVAWLPAAPCTSSPPEDTGGSGPDRPAQDAGARRRLAQLGVTPDRAERAVDVIARALASGGRDTRELARSSRTARVPAEGQALPHLLALAARRA
jgi:hypothetical protein